MDNAVAAQHKHGVVLAGLCRNLGRFAAARGETYLPAYDRSLARLQGSLDFDGPFAPAPALRRRVRYDERLAPSGFHAGCSYLSKSHTSEATIPRQKGWLHSVLPGFGDGHALDRPKAILIHERLSV